MNKIKQSGSLAIALAVLLTAIVAPVGSAQSAMSESHVERIRANCVQAQNTLRQLHTNDALLRVNRGQAYESISVKFMAVMNSRIAINRLDGGNMVSVAVSYEKELADFRTSYQSYEQHMSDLLKIDCVDQPVTFYDQVAITRQLRNTVHDHVVKLHQYINDYGLAFEAFRVQFKAQAGKVEQ